jgi:chromosome segregation ATPase
MERRNIFKDKEREEEEKSPNGKKNLELGNDSEEEASPLQNMSKEEQRKMHEKMLEDDLKGLESKLTQQFLADNKFIQDQINQPIEIQSSKPKSLPKKLKIKNIPEGALPHTYKMEQLTRKLDEEYYNGIKATNKIPKNSKKLFDELEDLKQKVNDIKQVNRDEELLRMQRENQEIEEKLNQLKQQDNTELKEKQENCRKLVEQLNVLFNERKKDAAEKEKEREEAIAQIKKIKQEQEKHKKEINDLIAKKEELTQMLQNLEKDVESYNIYKKFIEQVNAKYSNDTTNQNDLYDNLKEKFEQLMNHEIEIQKNIEDSEKEKEEIRKQIQEMRRKNDKQSQNTRLQELENEIKEYTDKNKQLEQEIDSILKEKQKKDSDTHQIKLSIFNLYDKVMKDDGKVEKNDNFDMDADETQLCMKLDKINEKIMDLIKIHKALESQNANSGNANK